MTESGTATRGNRWTGLWSSGWRASTLPPDVLADSCRRVAAVALAFAGLWTFALLMNNVVAGFFDMPLSMPGPSTDLTVYNGVSGTGLALSLLMLFLAGRVPTARGQLLDLGLIYMILTAVCVSLVTLWEPAANRNGISWVAFLIVAYSSIAPNTPRKVLAAGLVAASTDPLAMGLALARGLDLPMTGFEVAWMVIPNYLAALIAVIPAQIYGGLGRRVREAREVGSYRLGDLLGRGGMGEVYRAEHRLLARPAAVKLIRPELLDPAQSASIIERFRREAHAAATLSSPHTISLYDFGVAAGGAFYYVMELLDGLDCDALVRRYGPQPPERVAHILGQAAASLAEAHSLGMIHRDIKPSNVFVARLGHELDFVKVLDFGLVAVRRGAEAARTRLTAPESIPGTPNVMAPEVASGDAEPDARADVYALGCLGYWLLTGKPVFEGEGPIQVMLRHIRDEPVPPSRRSPHPEAAQLDPLLLACLAKNPADRPCDAGVLRKALARVEFDTPWTGERARDWWTAHLSGGGPEPGPCDKAVLEPIGVSTGSAD